jgi:hypothetical protein
MVNPIHDKPFPVKLGDLKPHLQMDAFENERSLHYWIKKILAEHLIQTGRVKKEDVKFNPRFGGSISITS